MGYADANISNNLLSWVIVIFWCAVLNSDLALLPWVIIAFVEHTWVMILTHWPVTLHICNPLITLSIPIRPSRQLWLRELCRFTIQDSLLGYQCNLSKQVIQHVNISMTHQNNIARQLEKGTLTLCLFMNEYHSCVMNDWAVRSKCERNHSIA